MQAHTASEPLSPVLMRDSDFMEEYEWLHGYFVVEDFTFEKFTRFLGELVHVHPVAFGLAHGPTIDDVCSCGCNVIKELGTSDRGVFDIGVDDLAPGCFVV